MTIISAERRFAASDDYRRRARKRRMDLVFRWQVVGFGVAIVVGVLTWNGWALAGAYAIAWILPAAVAARLDMRSRIRPRRRKPAAYSLAASLRLDNRKDIA